MYMFKNDALKQSTKHKRKLIPSDYDSRIADVLAGLPDEMPESETAEVKIVRSRFDIKPFVSAAAVFALAAACVFTYPKFSNSAFDKNDDSNSGTDGSITQAVTSASTVTSAETTSVSSVDASVSETSVLSEKETEKSISDDILYVPSDTVISSYIISDYIPAPETVKVPSVTVHSDEKHNYETEALSVPDTVPDEPVKPIVTEIPSSVTETEAETETVVTKPVPPVPPERPEEPKETAVHPVPPVPVPPENDKENNPKEPELPWGRDDEGHPVHPVNKDIEMNIVPAAQNHIHDVYEHISETNEISE